MEIQKIRRDAPIPADGLIVVIDVVRAFTTAVCAFAQGAEKIILVAEVAEAIEKRKRYPGALLMGEVNGRAVSEFDFSNSPAEILRQDLSGKTLVQRTSSGTQGVVASRHADEIVTASFVNAEATFKYIQEMQPKKVTFVTTGMNKGGCEDRALADYLEQKLLGCKVDPTFYLTQVLLSSTGQMFLSGEVSCFTKQDLDICVALDRFSLATKVFKQDGELILKPILQ